MWAYTLTVNLHLEYHFFANGIHRSFFLPTGLLSTFIWWEALINFQFQFADILGTDFSILNWANIHSPSVLHTFTCYEPWCRAQIWGLKDGQNHSPEILLNLTDHSWAPLEQRFVMEDLWKVKNMNESLARKNVLFFYNWLVWYFPIIYCLSILPGRNYSLHA